MFDRGDQGHGKVNRHSFSSVFLPFPRKMDEPLTLIPPLPPRRLAFLKQQGSSLGDVPGLTGPFLDSSILDISQDALRFIEKLGEGLFIEARIKFSYLLDASEATSSGSSQSFIVSLLWML